MRPIILSALLMGVIVQAGPCKMNPPSSLSASPSTTSATLSAVSSTYYTPVTATSTFSSTAIVPPLTKSTSTSVIEVVTPTTTPSGPSFIPAATAKRTNGDVVNLYLSAPIGLAPRSLFTGTSSIPAPATLAIDAATRRLYAQWSDGTVRWASVMELIPEEISRQPVEFSQAAHVHQNGRRYYSCEGGMTVPLLCKAENLNGELVFTIDASGVVRVQTKVLQTGSVDPAIIADVYLVQGQAVQTQTVY